MQHCPQLAGAKAVNTYIPRLSEGVYFLRSSERTKTYNVCRWRKQSTITNSPDRLGAPNTHKRKPWGRVAQGAPAERGLSFIQ